MPIYKGEVTVKCTVDVTIKAESLADAERIASDIYATASVPLGVEDTGEFSDLMFITLFEDEEHEDKAMSEESL
jgi:hypothetical protein